MCSLCGILGANEHWADAAAREGVYTRNADPMRRRRERVDRVRLANQVLAFYGMKLSDWQGASFLLSTFTGKSEMVEDLGHLWPVAEKNRIPLMILAHDSNDVLARVAADHPELRLVIDHLGMTRGVSGPEFRQGIERRGGILTIRAHEQRGTGGCSETEDAEDALGVGLTAVRRDDDLRAEAHCGSNEQRGRTGVERHAFGEGHRGFRACEHRVPLRLPEPPLRVGLRTKR